MMSIERLQKAANAAGYAMAAVEDDEDGDDVSAASPVRPMGTALMLAPPVLLQTSGPRHVAGPRDIIVSSSAWLKSLLPAFGGRAPA